MSPLEILLTEEREVDQILWLRFGRSYLILELVLFSRIESCFAIIGLDYISVGYKYEPPVTEKDRYTSKQINFTICNLFSRQRLRHLFLFLCEFFQANQGRLTFERLGLLVSLHLRSKSELLLPGASLWLRSNLFKIYRIYLSFDLGRIAVFLFRSIHKLSGLVICLIGY